MKKYYEAVTFIGSTWGLYGEKVVDHRCDHKHRSEKSAWNCKDIKDGYCNEVRQTEEEK